MDSQNTTGDGEHIPDQDGIVSVEIVTEFHLSVHPDHAGAHIVKHIERGPLRNDHHHRLGGRIALVGQVEPVAVQVQDLGALADLGPDLAVLPEVGLIISILQHPFGIAGEVDADIALHAQILLDLPGILGADLGPDDLIRLGIRRGSGDQRQRHHQYQQDAP